jgi:hypothetical protein
MIINTFLLIEKLVTIQKINKNVDLFHFWKTPNQSIDLHNIFTVINESLETYGTLLVGGEGLFDSNILLSFSTFFSK